MKAGPWIKLPLSHTFFGFMFLHPLRTCNEPSEPIGTEFFSPYSTKLHCVGLLGPGPNLPGPG